MVSFRTSTVRQTENGHERRRLASWISPCVDPRPSVVQQRALFFSLKSTGIPVRMGAMTTLGKNFAIGILILLLISFSFALLEDPLKKKTDISLSQTVQDIKEGKVEKITVAGNELLISLKDGSLLASKKETEASLSQTLLNYGLSPDAISTLQIEQKEDTGLGSWLGPLALTFLPLLLFLVFFFMIFRQARAGVGQAFDFTKTRARLFGAEGQMVKERVTFKNVAGLKEAKEELVEVVDFLKNPKKYLEMGASIPRGVLLVGPPGCGKTLLARAVASEAGVPFFSASGSEFIEMFVGVGSSVTGDTPVLIRTEEKTRLIPIGEFVDQYYKENEEGSVVKTRSVQTLGYEKERSRFWGSKNSYGFFGQSSWKNVQGVYRHKTQEIYEIKYLGGKLRTTGDHSVFVRHRNLIVSKRVDELKEGEMLVNLPFKVRSKFVPGFGTTHRVKTHAFPESQRLLELPVWNDNEEQGQWEAKYAFALAHREGMSQEAIGTALGVSQATVGLWQRGIHKPRFFLFAALNEEKHIPQRILATKELLKLLGYYTAEGRTEDYYMQFVFGAHEKDYPQECVNLMRSVFGIEPHLKYTEDNSLRITYHSVAVSKFFERHCATGSKNKHVPEFLWNLSRELFLAYLEGYTNGDGHTDKSGRLVAGSVSKQLILELAWLSSMHGIQVGIGKSTLKEGRVIKNHQKPLPGGTAWTIKFGKSSHPFATVHEHPNQFKKPVIQKITKKPFEGYVYDLIGCDNEAFFGGIKPTLLHNSRVRDLFSTAKKAGRSIIFIDELDAIGRVRGFGFSGGHEEREQTLNQILVEMDGFDRDDTRIVIAATNRPDVLDPALLRPGRFDRRIVLDLPDVNDRKEILEIHAKGKPLSQNARLREVAERTPGFSGADLANLMNEAALFAARRNKTQVTQSELLESIDKVLLGPERKSHILSKKEKEVTAFHEAGHALVSASLSHTDPVRKISIISRGRAGGYTLKLPTEDRHLKSRAEFLDELSVLLGGYTAEKLTFKDVTTGAANDLQKASEIARALVKEFGMSEKLGPVTFRGEEKYEMFSHGLGASQEYSDSIALEIDKEVSKLIGTARKVAERILKAKKNTLAKIAKILIEKETIEQEEFEKIVVRKKKV